MNASYELHGGYQVPGPVDGATRLLVAGDTHGNLDWIGSLSKLAARNGCQGVIQLGDFGMWCDQAIWRSEARFAINDRWLSAIARAAAFQQRLVVRHRRQPRRSSSGPSRLPSRRQRRSSDSGRRARLG